MAEIQSQVTVIPCNICQLVRFIPNFYHVWFQNMETLLILFPTSGQVRLSRKVLTTSTAAAVAAASSMKR